MTTEDKSTGNAPEELAGILAKMRELNENPNFASLKGLTEEGIKAILEVRPKIADFRAALLELSNQAQRGAARQDKKRSDLRSIYESAWAHADKLKEELDRDAKEFNRRSQSESQRQWNQQWRKSEEKMLAAHRRIIQQCEKMEKRLIEVKAQMFPKELAYAESMLQCLDRLNRGITSRRGIVIKGASAATGAIIGMLNPLLGIIYEIIDLINQITTSEIDQAGKFIARLKKRIDEFRILSMFLPELTAIIRRRAVSLQTDC